MEITVTPYECYTKSFTPLEHHVIYNCLMYQEENFEHINRQTNGSWDGWASMYDLRMSEGSFLTGFLERVVNELSKNNIFYEIKDLREFPEPYLDNCRNILELRPYQDKVIEAVSLHPQSFLRGACSMGKTPVSSALFSKFRIKTLVIVDRVLLMKQSYKSYKEFNPDANIGRIGAGYCQYGDFTIAVINTIGARLKQKDPEMIDFIRNTEMIICDEAHLGTSKRHIEVLKLCQSPIRYGLSATPEHRKNYDNMMVEGLYGPVRDETIVRGDELMADNYISKVYTKFIDIDFPSNEKLRKIRSKKEASDRLIHFNGYRNKTIVDLSNNIVNNAKERPIVIFKYREHGAELLEAFQEHAPDLKIGYMDGTTSTSIRDKIQEDYINGDIDLILASFIFSTGISIDSITYLIYTGGGAPKAGLIQILGRLARKDEGKKCGYMIDFNDKTHIKLSGDTELRKQIILSEPGYEILGG